MRNRPPLVATGIVLAALLVLSACRSSERPTVAPAGVDAQVGARSELRPLDEAHAGEFRWAFDESREHRRYIVALSPT